MSDWEIFKQNIEPHDGIENLPPPPSWRPFGQKRKPGESRLKRRGETFQVRPDEVKMINAALYLRRPLLITGKPGTGKSSLAYAVARQLKLGEVLYWPITTRTTLKEGLYSYDAIGRLQEAKQQENQNNQTLSPEQRREQIQQIEKYITLGSLGTSLLPSKYPRVLLIDEIDKSDIDLPNNLLAILEEGSFEIPELVRIKKEVDKVTVRTAYTDATEEKTASEMEAEVENGRITCTAFPFVVMTSNGERDFPAPFLRRCLRLRMKSPTKEELTKIVTAHFNNDTAEQEKIQKLIEDFIDRREEGTLATDQLLNAIFMVTEGRIPATEDKLVQQLFQDLGRVDDED
ncbi:MULTISPECIES: MoxR family ATPase [Okeania]|uniref:AAA family ATPase n=1 Tax=Okeania hirsuta TaxID=1458930 RepID=A0A3N6Q126_9CYAN|nr:MULTISPECIES: MoxR family ATPase [Okeania]NET15738.1 AAA family ATPase [Okeania sp. SIO1H6]NES78084.1 AAA family ATPase [Okeania sp. SIO1H4]NES88014.1 AAA family ATPase [Okeania sp. SIO2B9]NET18823.1 AAA family ATPase [Okeania sp. SIO1H5]NET76849.1 AAA family ATPase [Okeania sp. SIO1F9]